MKQHSKACHGVFALLMVLGPGVSGCKSEPPADLILTGGRVYTMNPEQPRAEAVAVRGDRIVFVGGREGALAKKGPGTKILDLEGMTTLPGLIDAHGHLPNLGRTLRELKLLGTSSSSEIREMVIARRKQVAAGEWIAGRGWDQNDWQVQEFPTWQDLHGTEDNPVYLRRVDGHAVWVNRRALELCGVTRDTPDPEGGRIVRDEEGQPTGVFVDRAVDLVSSRIPKPSMEERIERVRVAIRECRRYGLTGVHDAGTTEDYLGVYRRLLEDGELTLRVYTMLDCDSTRFVRARLEEGPWADPQHFVTVRAIKVYADGAMGSRGAMLLEPYSDEPSNRGLLQNPRHTIEEWAGLALEGGFQMCAHAIGDGGNRLILDVYETALRARPVSNHRFRVEHAQLLALDDIPRFASMAVIASMQPTHATSDMYWAEDRVGAERIQGAYAWRKLLRSGAVIACGSDFPVESVNPLWGVYAAVTRQDHSEWPEGGWYPDERMTVYEAIEGFTTAAAFASFEEHLKGSIEPGKFADFTIVDHDLFEIAPGEILETSVRYTIVGGKVVYSAAE
ncbi:MAG: amidohydrolase [Candidatus Krumholzibacteria bacterium]